MGTTRRRPRGSRIAAAACAIALAAALGAEALSRSRETDTLIYRDSLEKDLLFEPIPGTQGRIEGADVHLNSRGLRDREYSPEKPAGVELRLLALGGSLVFGRGAAGPAVFTERLEQELGPRYEVVNGAVCAYSSGQSLSFYERRLADLRPDVLVLVVSPDQFDASGDRLVSSFPRLKNFVREHSALARACMEGAYRRRLHPSDGGLHAATRRSRRKRSRPPPGAEVREEFLRGAGAIVQRAKRISEKDGFRLALLYLPRLERLHLEPEDAERREAFRAASEAEGVVFWDATEALAQGVVTDLLVGPNAGYLNEKGHAAVAAFVRSRLSRARWL